MKKILITILGALLALPGLARDFTYTYEGQTLTYTVLDEDAKTCKTKDAPHTMKPDGGYTVNGMGNTVSGDLVIPSHPMDGETEFTVTEIGFYGFRRNPKLISVKIPETITSIGGGAFDGCSGLTSITLPETLTSIGESTFYGCSGLTSITLPETLTTIGDIAFCNCSGLTSITLPETLTTIGNNAFSNCSSLTSITLPETLTTIGSGAFYKCSGLASITLPETLTSIGGSAFYNCSDLTSITLPETLTTIEYGTFEGCTGLTSITIPESIISIGSYAFKECSGLETIYFNAKNCTKCGRYETISTSSYIEPAWPNSVKNIVIGDNVTRIPNAAFNGCNSVDSVTIGESVVEFEDSFGCYPSTVRFYAEALPKKGNYFGSSIKTLVIGDKVKEIPDNAFEGSSGLTSLTIGNSVTTIGKNAFGSSKLTSVTIPESVTSIGDDAFTNCPLETVYFNAENCVKCGTLGDASSGYRYTPAFGSIKTLIIGNNVKTIPDNAFRGSDWVGRVGTVILGNSITSIGERAFYNSSTTSIVIPESVRTIGDAAFFSSSLKSVIIPASVTEMGNNVFGSSVTRGAYPSHLSNPFPTSAYTFVYSPENVRYDDGCLYSPDKTTMLFGPWVNGEYALPETVTTIADNAFKNCSAMSSVIFRNPLANIGKDAFTGCSGLASLTSYASPAPLFDTSAFTGLYDTVALNIPDNIQGDYANGYTDWRLFKSLNVLDNGSSEKFDTDQFAYRKINETDIEIIASDKYAPLTELIVPATLQIPDESEENPADPENPDTEVTEPKYITLNVISIAPNAFAGLENLTSVTVEEGVARIGTMAFKGCKNLTTVKLPSTVTEISSSTFQDCEKLAFFTSDAEITRIGAAAFAKTALTAVNLPVTTAIEEYAYSDVSTLQGLTLCDAIKTIGKGAFMNTSLKTVDLSSSVPLEIGDYAFASTSENTTLTTVKLGDGVATIGNSAFENCPKITSVSVGKDVKTIGDNAFSATNNGLRTLTFVKDGALRHIGDNAFHNLKIRGELSLPDNVVYIGASAFAYCQGITKIILPANSNLTIGDNAFINAQRLEALEFPAKIKSIGKNAFTDMPKVTELDIKADNLADEAFASTTTSLVARLSVTGNGAIGKSAFKGFSSLTDATLTIPVISESAFADLSQLANVSFGETLEQIGPSAFANCAIENLVFPTVENPEAVTVIESKAFAGNPLKRIALGNRMKQVNLLNTNIGIYNSDNSVDLGTTVQRIENGTFGHLKTLTLPASLEYINSTIGTDSLNIPASTTMINIDTKVTTNHVFIDRKYKAKSFASKYDLLANYAVRSLTFGETKGAGVIVYGFEDYVPNPHIGASVQGISNLSFRGNITFSEGIETIYTLTDGDKWSGDSAKTLKLPGSLKEIKSLICPNLGYLMFADSSEPLTLDAGNISAPSTSKLKEVYIGRDLTGTFTFTPWASTLEKAVIGDTVTTVKETLFKDCANLTNVIMSDNVTTIGSEAFYGCSGLQVLSLSEKVETIGDNAYAECTGLSRIVARGLVPPVGNAGFGADVEDNVPLYVQDDVIDAYDQSDLFTWFNKQGFNGTIVKEVTTENELPKEYVPGETFSIPELVPIVVELYEDGIVDPENPEEPAMRPRKVRRAAEETDLSKSFYYFSPDPDILTIDQAGTVTVKKEGEGRIWAYVLDGSDRKVEIGVNRFALEDFNHDGKIDSIDYQMLLSHIINPEESTLTVDKADLTKDNIVNSTDRQYLINKIIEKK